IGRALNAYDSDDAGSASAARAERAGVLAQPANASAHHMSAVGHAHIDSAWLWPLRETRRKVARTVSNVLDLMDQDPEMVYAMSSAQQYAWLEEDQPELFERMKARIAEGRFIPVGDRKSTRLNSSHVSISYAVFCLKKKIKNQHKTRNYN